MIGARDPAAAVDQAVAAMAQGGNVAVDIVLDENGQMQVVPQGRTGGQMAFQPRGQPQPQPSAPSRHTTLASSPYSYSPPPPSYSAPPLYIESSPRPVTSLISVPARFYQKPAMSFVPAAAPVHTPCCQSRPRVNGAKLFFLGVVVALVVYMCWLFA